MNFTSANFEGLDSIANTVFKSKNYPSIVKIKECFKVKGKFSFRFTTKEEINRKISCAWYLN